MRFRGDSKVNMVHAIVFLKDIKPIFLIVRAGNKPLIYMGIMMINGYMPLYFN